MLWAWLFGNHLATVEPGISGNLRTWTQTRTTLHCRERESKSLEYAVWAMAFCDREGIMGRLSVFFQFRGISSGFLQHLLS